MQAHEALARPVARGYTCKNCLKTLTRWRPPSRRAYSTELAPAKGLARLHSRRLIAVSGPDAAKYLQGAVTQNVAKQTGGFYTAFLNAQGRVLHDVFIFPRPSATAADAPDSFLIDVDAAQVTQLAKHIRRYKLRAKFDIRIVAADEMAVWSAWDVDHHLQPAQQQWTSYPLGGGESQAVDVHHHGSVVCVDGRAPGMGKRVLVAGAARPAYDADECDERTYTIRRYLKGVPEGQTEILSGTALPQESNIDYMGGIDYRKGCYVGQELTIRTHHTGVVRKRILPLQVYAEGDEAPAGQSFAETGVALPPAETNIARQGKKGRSAGKWLAGLGNIGLGLCRLEQMTGTTDAFAVQWEDGEDVRAVQVKAFVPPWHLAG